MFRRPPSLDNVLSRMTAEKLAIWETRAFTVIGYLKSSVPGCGGAILHMILRAALGHKGPAPGLTWTSHLGENAMIDKDRRVLSRYTDDDGTEMGVRVVCTVDELNSALGWLMEAIYATDTEYKAIVAKINAWIARDETQIGLHVERQRAALDEGKHGE